MSGQRDFCSARFKVPGALVPDPVWGAPRGPSPTPLPSPGPGPGPTLRRLQLSRPLPRSGLRRAETRAQRTCPGRGGAAGLRVRGAERGLGRGKSRGTWETEWGRGPGRGGRHRRKPGRGAGAAGSGEGRAARRGGGGDERLGGHRGVRAVALGHPGHLHLRPPGGPARVSGRPEPRNFAGAAGRAAGQGGRAGTKGGALPLALAAGMTGGRGGVRGLASLLPVWTPLSGPCTGLYLRRWGRARVVCEGRCGSGEFCAREPERWPPCLGPGEGPGSRGSLGMRHPATVMVAAVCGEKEVTGAVSRGSWC